MMKKCQMCPNALGNKYVTLIGPTPETTITVCWECYKKCDLKGTPYTPSIH